MQIDLIWHLTDAAVRASGLALIGFAGLAAFRVRSPAARHAVWTVVLAGMLLQVPLAMVVPSIPITVPRHQSGNTTSARTPSPLSPAEPPARPAPHRPASSRIPLRVVLTAVYAGVAFMLLCRVAIGFRGLRTILKHVRPLPELGPGIFESRLLPAPGSIGWLRPKILLPETWREWDRLHLQSVLAHESAHVRRQDWLTRIASEINAALFWFHPLAWWMRRELEGLAEESCDDKAVSALQSKQHYAEALAAVARGVHHRLDYRAVFMARESGVERRIDRILAPGYAASKPVGRAARTVFSVTGVAVIYLSAAMGLATPQAPGALYILVDNSGSMQDKTERARAIAVALVNGLGPDAEVRVRHFDDEAFGGTRDFTRDREVLRAALARIDSRGGKAMRDAIGGAIEEFASVRHDRKTIVLITEGFDTSSKTPEVELLRSIGASGVRVRIVGLLSDDPVRSGEVASALRRIAEASGGLALFPNRLESARAIVERILRDEP